MSVVEPEPASVSELFAPDRVELIRQFTANLAANGETLGLIGPLELPRIWTRHILNSALVSPLVRSGQVADVGSGAGLPGLVLAIARPDAHFTLIEPMERRTDWLRSQVSELALTNVAIERSRAEDVRPLGTFDQVTARAVSALRTLVPITAPLVRDGGELILLKGASVDKEMAAAAKAFSKYRLANPEIVVLGEQLGIEPTRVMRVTVRPHS